MGSVGEDLTWSLDKLDSGT